MASIDVTRPSIARVYDAALGGKDNFEVDRQVLRGLVEGMPEVMTIARINRDALGRGVQLMARRGIRRFLDLGAGLPTADNTHQVAQRTDPSCRVVYVDKDPIVLAHGQAILAGNANTAVVTADLRDPASILGHPDVKRLIDLGEPVGVMLVAILHHLHDDEDPKGLLDAYMAAVPPGSHVFVTHFCAFDPEVTAPLEEKFLRLLGSGRFRTPAEITALFDGYELLEPGVVPNPHWHPEAPVSADLTVGQRLHYTGLARKN
ncbi:SAM-dependent methyltransferase [Actinocorallia longicatena]